MIIRKIKCYQEGAYGIDEGHCQRIESVQVYGI